MKVSGFVTYFEFGYKDYENNKQLRDCLNNRQFFHKELQKMFELSRKDAGVLYRIECSKKGYHVVTVKSNTAPQVENSPLFRSMRVSKPIDMEGYYSGLSDGTRVRFKLEAMPYYSFYPEGAKNPKRRVITNEAARVDWINKKLEGAGVRVCKLSRNQEMDQKFLSKPGSPSGFFKTYDFGGEAVVFNQGLLARAIENGVGPEKAYGAGLLILY